MHLNLLNKPKKLDNLLHPNYKYAQVFEFEFCSLLYYYEFQSDSMFLRQTFWGAPHCIM